MELRIYNTLARKKEIFRPISKNEVKIYSCGPTVYWYQHIGNLRSYISWDLLKRALIFDGFKVKHVMNITDVGHLTSDADTGEDKMEKAVQREGKSAQEIANHYLEIFRDDFNKLNIIYPDFWPKATEHIKEQIEIIKILEKKGYTYKTSDGIYFDTSKVKDYGKLAKLNAKNLKAGKRIDIGEKKHKTDFALWKFSEKPGLRQQEWNPKEFGADWEIGFPGWHIECSAMSSKYLGNQFDIHTGGQEHIPIHHTNEIAQSEAAFGKKPWVRYWIHGAWLLFKGEKVSKSKGGLYTISQLEEQGFSPLEFRYLCLTTHYRKPLNFTLEKLKASKNSYQRLKKIIGNINKNEKASNSYSEEFENAINNDLDMPKALQVLWKLVRNKSTAGIRLNNKEFRTHVRDQLKTKLEIIKRMDEVLGLDLLKKEKIEIPEKIKKLVDEREFTRKSKNWKKADEIREKIKKLGYSLDDTKEGVAVKKI